MRQMKNAWTEHDNERLKAMVVAGASPDRAISSLEAAIEPTCRRLCANQCDQLEWSI